MRTVLAWSDRLPDAEGIKSMCNGMAFRPDGRQLIAAVGMHVLVYDALEGNLIHSLTGHKDVVFCVAYSRDGKRFASGGADKTVIIWTHKAEGILKYSHSDSVQCLSYNPVTQQLASGTASDFGIWSPEQKAVSKHKAVSKILCMAWTRDGRFLAMGTYHGQILICDENGSEQMKIDRSAPVWTLQWNSTQNKTSDTLAVGCWDGTLSFYNAAGKQVGNDKKLGYDPCSITYHDGKYLCIGGSNKQVFLYSKDGIKLTTMCETADWVWAVCSCPKQDYVAVGCKDGTISMLQLVFSMVHGLFLEWYAFRDAMTDLIVQNLLTNNKVRIKCHDYVKKIAIYQKHVAVQLLDRIVIYELFEQGSNALQYEVCATVHKSFECNLLVLTSWQIILCQETKLQLYTFEGESVREWHLDSTIRYIKVCGGPIGGEGLLVGLKNGSVVRIWIHNDLPVCLLKHSGAIRCLDLSAERSQLASVDENGNLLVYHLQKKEVIFEEKFVSSVAWNTQMDALLCFSGSGFLNVRAGNYPLQRQKLQGYVVGFQGSTIFALNHGQIQTFDLPQSLSMRQYVASGDYQNAYKVACLGVTDEDWEFLALNSLEAQSLKVARASFTRLQDVRYLDLLHNIETGTVPANEMLSFLGLVYAYEGKFEAAAKLFCEVGQIQKAVEMFADLQMFDEVKALEKRIGNEDEITPRIVQDILEKHAEQMKEKSEHEKAIDMHLIAGEPKKALAVVLEHGPPLKLIEVARRLKKSDSEELRLCAELLKRHGLNAHAFETYTKLEDFRSVLLLHVELQQWDDAFAIKRVHPELQENVFLPYAEWLISQDQFEKAQMAYKEAGHPELSRRLLEQLLRNAVKERRFNDASFSCLQLAFGTSYCAGASCVGDMEFKMCDEMKDKSLWRLAELYYAYSFIDQYIIDPFPATAPETLFNIALFLLVRLGCRQPPPGISMVSTLRTLAKLGEHLGCYKVAHSAYRLLQELCVPLFSLERLDVASLRVRARVAAAHYSGPELENPFCFCCSSPLPLFSSWKDACCNCSQPVFRSFVTFNRLPVVEFTLEDGVTHDMAMNLLFKHTTASYHHDDADDENLIIFNDDSKKQNIKRSTLVLTDALEKLFSLSESESSSVHLQASQSSLRRLKLGRVLIQNSTDTGHPRYLYNLDPSLALHQCPCCYHLFEKEMWDLAQLQEGHCPFCRTRNNNNNTSGLCKFKSITSKMVL